MRGVEIARDREVSEIERERSKTPAVPVGTYANPIQNRREAHAGLLPRVRTGVCTFRFGFRPNLGCSTG